MRAILLSTLALGALTSAALAGQPLTLTDKQMDMVTAGVAPGFGRFTAYTTERSAISGPLNVEPPGRCGCSNVGEGINTAKGTGLPD